ncbi:MAG: hypothetical protein HFJ09_09665 [Lachnospiraceae bacterium]|nr:hypothetical protein [Lachnospiraceae bacterium]
MGNITENMVFRIKRNLTDAGCNHSQIEQFLDLMNKKNRQEQYRFLSNYRLKLLQKLHESEHQIDCLDFLVYSMQQEDKKEELSRYLNMEDDTI